MLQARLMNNLRQFSCDSSSSLRLVPLGILLCALCLAPDIGCTAEVTIAWDANDEPDLAGYHVSYGTKSGDYQYKVDVGNYTSCSISGLEEGETYFFAATAYDTELNESSFSEEISYTVPPTDPDGDGISIEAGEIQVNHNWFRVEFQEVFDDPIVIASSFSQNGGDPGVIRIRGIDRSGFEIKVQEWDYLDSSHALELVGYIVIERGNHKLPDGTLIEAGSFETDKTGKFATVSFTQTFNDVPIVLTSIASVNEADTATGRIREISTQGYEFCMQEQEANSTAHRTETINYIAWEPSAGHVDKLAFEVGRTGNAATHRFDSLQFSQMFSNPPVFIADMQTADGLNTANVRWRNKNAKIVEVQIDEEQSKDAEIFHTTESVGFMAFSSLGKAMIWLEAENGYLETPMQIDSDDTASSGEFIWIPNGNGNVWDPSYRGGQAEYTFNIPQSGNYVIWGLVIAGDSSDDSFFVAVDEGNFALWDTKQGAAWTWDQVNSRDEADPVFFNLEAGEHSLVIKQREDGTKLDKILITNDLEYIPE